MAALHGAILTETSSAPVSYTFPLPAGASMTATVNSGYPVEGITSFLGTQSFTYSKLTVTQSNDPNATVGENIDFYGFGQTTGLKYAEFGLWALNSSVLNSGSAYIGTYGGALSPTPAGAVPTTGSATYNGVAIGSIQNAPANNSSQVAGFSGNLGLNANFTAGSITGSITDIQAYIFGVLKGSVNDIGIAATISGTNISGTTAVTGVAGSGYDITGATGTLVGVFAGPTGSEVAGSFNLTGGANTNSVIGSFGAGNTLAPVTLTPAPTATFFSEETTIGGAMLGEGSLKTGQSFVYTGALPNGITGSPATANFTVTTAGGIVSGTAALGSPVAPVSEDVQNITVAPLTVTSSTDATVSGTTGTGILALFDETYGLSYTTFGYWSVGSSGSSSSYVGVVAGGKPGVSPTTAAAMPTTGTASFAGGAAGQINQPGGYTVPAGSSASAGTAATWTGNTNLTATWSSNSLTGTITGISASAVDGSGPIGSVNDINLAGTISGSSVSGTATAASTAGTAFNTAGASGPLQAAFYGPAANEVAGTFHMTGGTNNVTVIGAIGAKQVAKATPSDIRLKTDIAPAGTLPNGLRLYHWRYLGGAHRFTGVMAQDVARDARFAGAVTVDGEGLMRVDYDAIGYSPADLVLMQQEGEAAATAYRVALH